MIADCSPLVKVTGDVDYSSCSHVHDVMVSVLRCGFCSPRVDLGGVRYVDSTGFCTVIRLYDEFRSHDVRLEVVSVNPVVKRLFQVAGREDIIVDSLECSTPGEALREPVTECAADAGGWAMSSFSVAAALQSGKTVRDRVSALAGNLQFTPEEMGDIKIAVGEAITNAIRHGSRGEDDLINIRCIAWDGELIVEISDNGPGFDLDAVSSASMKQGMLEGGMGITCMKRSVDSVSFDFSHGTTVRLTKQTKSSKQPTQAPPGKN